MNTKRILWEIARERKEREKGERPWTQMHHLETDSEVSRRGYLRRPKPQRAPRPRREPGECATPIKLENAQ